MTKETLQAEISRANRLLTYLKNAPSTEGDWENLKHHTTICTTLQIVEDALSFLSKESDVPDQETLSVVSLLQRVTQSFGPSMVRLSLSVPSVAPEKIAA